MNIFLLFNYSGRSDECIVFTMSHVCVCFVLSVTDICGSKNALIFDISIFSDRKLNLVDEFGGKNRKLPE